MMNDGHGTASKPIGVTRSLEPGHVAPRAEGLVPNGAIFHGRAAVTVKLEVVVEPAVSGQETLRLSD